MNRRVLLAAVLAAGLAACLWLSWPGQFSPDSIWQLMQGRTGVYNNWHPPVMAWLLGLFDRVSPGAAGFIVFDAGLGYGALLAFAALSPRPRWSAILAAAAFCASPLLLIYQGDVWKDVLFADAGVAGFAALAWADRRWHERPWRYGLIALALVLFALAVLARQNGALVALWAAVGLAALAWRHAHSGPRRPAIAVLHGALALAGCLVLAGAGATFLAAHGDGDPAQAQQVEWVQAWDLAGALRADPKFDLRALQATSPDAASLVRGAAPVWKPSRIDSLILYPGADEALDGAGPAVASQWRSLILTRPLLYARVRLAVLGQILATPNLGDCRPLFIGLDGDKATLDRLKLPPRNRDRDAQLRAYGVAFVGTPVLSHLVYVGLGLVAAAFAVRDMRRRRDIGDNLIILAMLGAAASFALSFAVVGLSCDYRYLYLLDLAAMAAVLHRLAKA
ncbi:hypothetical protein [Phenylobacterium montanum]|uniref:Uncharacterized protein n=1 Tax=Phenylobacterium montanum TaxID=2823693 RepID=A0A975G1P0_9CAUL|nr:hypothetical protein [Caulobacter sp. S6]QUD88928.1 hypothetical protein KCG34_03295 [Caulobacter sp. S6]